MGHHLTKENKFKSDKYEWCQEGFLALKFTDPTARLCINMYAVLNKENDHELSEDLVIALKNTEND